LCAFIFANGYASLGVEVKMWFMIWGYNCLKKRRRLFSFRRKPDPVREGAYRVLETDNFLQPMVEMLNRGGAGHLPLSRLNLMGLGPPSGENAQEEEHPKPGGTDQERGRSRREVHHVPDLF
jgi:peroxiredoxin family protein